MLSKRLGWRQITLVGIYLLVSALVSCVDPDRVPRFRENWSGKWAGEIREVADRTTQEFTLVLALEKDQVSGSMRDADGSLANIAGYIKFIDKEKVPWKKKYELEFIKDYGNGIKVKWISSGIGRDDCCIEINGTWCREDGEGSEKTIAMGTWRMWPVK